jgi:hypothetical protein
LDPSILNRSLKLIEQVYDESMYGDDDLYRIKDIVHSVDSKQWTSKRWLVDSLKHLQVDLQPGIFIAGGWYGLMAYLLREQYPKTKIVSADMDKKSKLFGRMLFDGSNIDFITIDVTKNEYTCARNGLVVSTSCEHIDRDDLCEFIRKKDPDAVIALQSNDYFELPSHINCSSSLDDFVSYVQPALHHNEILFQGSLNLGDFNRFMVIGR